VSVLWKYVECFSNITILDSASRIAVPVFFDMISEELNPQEIISLIPFPHARLSTQGFRWNLNDEVLELSKREGARNISMANSVQILHHEGRFLFFCDSRLPALPLFTNYPS
jgi:thiamine pyrophosphokinase